MSLPQAQRRGPFLTAVEYVGIATGGDGGDVVGNVRHLPGKRSAHRPARAEVYQLLISAASEYFAHEYTRKSPDFTTAHKRVVRTASRDLRFDNGVRCQPSQLKRKAAFSFETANTQARHSAVAKKLSATALSSQLPLGLMLCTIR